MPSIFCFLREKWQFCFLLYMNFLVALFCRFCCSVCLASSAEELNGTTASSNDSTERITNIDGTTTLDAITTNSTRPQTTSGILMGYINCAMMMSLRRSDFGVQFALLWLLIKLTTKLTWCII